MKKTCLTVLLIPVLLMVMVGCGKNEITQTENETEEVTESDNETDKTNNEIAPENNIEPTTENIAIVEEVEGAFTFNIHGKSFEFGKSMAETMEDLDVERSFGINDFALKPGEDFGAKMNFHSGQPGEFYLIGYNDTEETLYSPDEIKCYHINADLLSARKSFFTLKDGLTFGSNYDDILNVYGTPSKIENVIAKDLFWDYGGEPFDFYCEKYGIPLKESDEGYRIRYRYSEKKYIYFIVFENTGLTVVGMTYEE